MLLKKVIGNEYNTNRGIIMETKENRLNRVLNWVKNEYLKATEKFGSFHNAHEGYAVILEEMDELWANVKLKQSHIDRDFLMMMEAKQVAAMAIRFIMDCCKKLLCDDNTNKS